MQISLGITVLGRLEGGLEDIVVCIFNKTSYLGKWPSFEGPTLADYYGSLWRKCGAWDRNRATLDFFRKNYHLFPYYFTTDISQEVGSTLLILRVKNCYVSENYSYWKMCLSLLCNPLLYPSLASSQRRGIWEDRRTQITERIQSAAHRSVRSRTRVWATI